MSDRPELAQWAYITAMTPKAATDELWASCGR